MQVGKVVGAEAERALLETLIIKRCELLGEDPDLKLAEAGFGNQFGLRYAQARCFVAVTHIFFNVFLLLLLLLRRAVSALAGNAEDRFAHSTAPAKVKGKQLPAWEV
jgi:hypothetical protein